DAPYSMKDFQLARGDVDIEYGPWTQVKGAGIRSHKPPGKGIYDNRLGISDNPSICIVLCHVSNQNSRPARGDDQREDAHVQHPDQELLRTGVRQGDQGPAHDGGDGDADGARRRNCRLSIHGEVEMLRPCTFESQIRKRAAETFASVASASGARRRGRMFDEIDAQMASVDTDRHGGIKIVQVTTWASDPSDGLTSSVRVLESPDEVLTMLASECREDSRVGKAGREGQGLSAPRHRHEPSPSGSAALNRVRDRAEVEKAWLVVEERCEIARVTLGAEDHGWMRMRRSMSELLEYLEGRRLILEEGPGSLLAGGGTNSHVQRITCSQSIDRLLVLVFYQVPESSKGGLRGWGDLRARRRVVDFPRPADAPPER
ncbi:hypothetical protein THAOC_31894, partial [Thalassiosira oceanica]